MRKILRYWRVIAGQQTCSEWMLKLLDINGKKPLFQKHVKAGAVSVFINMFIPL